MKNKELIKELSIRLNWSQDDVSAVISGLGSVIGESLSGDDTVFIEGLGQFETRKKGERLSVNPANGKRYLVPPKLVPVFKAGLNLKTKLKELANQ
jgi:DNA-binding protein HU-beta